MSNHNRDDASNPQSTEDFASLFAEYEKQQGGNKYKRHYPRTREPTRSPF